MSLGWLNRLFLAALLVGLANSATAAVSGYWTGYWTYVPPWEWTWVWVDTPPSGLSTSGVGSAAPRSAGVPYSCCGITIFNFASLDPVEVKYTGLLATSFTKSYNSGLTGVDLTITYDGNTPLTPGEALGTMVLINPDANPTLPAVRLDYTAAFETTGGLSQGAGVIESLPEPRSWALLVTGLAGLGAALRGRRRTAGAALG